MWQGVLIEESLENRNVLKVINIIKTDIKKLEEENRIMTFHKIEVQDSDKFSYLDNMLYNIKDSFYCHICKGGEMYVVFKGVLFKFTKGSPELKKAREYGKSIGIIGAQMPFEHLVDHPFN